MLLVTSLFIVGITLVFWAIISIVLLSLTLATIGKSLGIRKAFAGLFLRLFEWVTVGVEQKVREIEIDQYGESEVEEDENVPTIKDQHQFLIKRDASSKIYQKIMEKPTRSKAFIIADDSLDFLKAGMESIIDDQVTCRFSSQELRVWNLMTRTSGGHQYVSLKFTIIWSLGFLFRYCILVPVRLIIFTVGMVLLVISTALIGNVPQGNLKRWLHWHLTLMCFRVLGRALSIVATYHNPENKAKPGGICVANHTSPLDVQMLSMDNIYAFVGQRQGGFLGFLQKTMSRASDHVWFERAEASDRQAVSRRLREHVEDDTKPPILIFPEGTCINNTSIMMFKKGSFEVGGIIYPAAIKYDPRFGEAFWNSSKQTYFQYIMMMMTSWAIVVDVYYLPPVTKQPGESGMAFAARVKHQIASVGGFVELDWDGELKRKAVKPEMVEQQRQRWSQRVQMAPNKTLDLGDGEEHNEQQQPSSE